MCVCVCKCARALFLDQCFAVVLPPPPFYSSFQFDFHIGALVSEITRKPIQKNEFSSPRRIPGPVDEMRQEDGWGEMKGRALRK